jgi:precorrin-6A/cobalt-precorrin-6A reductase
MPVLLLGGTAEARALAAALHPRVSIVSSLAGRVPDPALPVGSVRIGGFGGVEGLSAWLQDNGIDAVVDATHPFAATITANAVAACERQRIPYLMLARPAWDPGQSIRVKSDAEAAKAVAKHDYSRVFLTTGRSGVAAFNRSTAWFLIRVVTPPDPAALPARHEVVQSRGPYRYADECELMLRHRIDVLVTKNSGGELTRSKLMAAEDLGIDVVMIDRPAVPTEVPKVATAADAVDWVIRAIQNG